jgi:hypothetical protein
MPSLRKFFPILFLFALQGCLSTWIRMEDGTVMAPGRSDFAMALGSVPRASYSCPENAILSNRSDGSVACGTWTYATATDSFGRTYGTSGMIYAPARRSLEREPHLALAWRLGALGPFGPFTGLELGIQAEAATNPVSQEYKLALGLPGSDSIVSHSLIGGWGTGLWVDNTWFLQYAASRRSAPWLFYGSLRTTLQATQIADLLSSMRLNHNRTWDVQAAAGVKLKLGDAPVIPDWMILGTTVDLTNAAFPSFDGTEAKQVGGVGVAIAFGMGWTW